MIMTEENKEEGNVEHVGSIKERLQHVASEIDTIKNSFSKSTEDLSRVQNMLNVGGLEEISGVIEQFEGRLTEGARKYSEELEKEKERLIKLWDAYKNQEEELSNTEKRISEYEERARMAEVSKKQLEDDLTGGPLSEPGHPLHQRESDTPRSTDRRPRRYPVPCSYG